MQSLFLPLPLFFTPGRCPAQSQSDSAGQLAAALVWLAFWTLLKGASVVEMMRQTLLNQCSQPDLSISLGDWTGDPLVTSLHLKPSCHHLSQMLVSLHQTKMAFCFCIQTCLIPQLASSKVQTHAWPGFTLAWSEIQYAKVNSHFHHKFFSR